MTEKNILILATTNEFLGKFEQQNVKILRQKGFTVHYAANMNEPSYLYDIERIKKLGVQAHHIEIARSPYMFQYNTKAFRQLLHLIRKYRIGAIHCHTPVGGLLGRLVGLLPQKERPIILYTAHGFHFYKGAPLFNHLFYYPVERFLAHNTDILIVINEEDYRNAKRFRLKKGGSLYKIPGEGLDLDVFHPVLDEEKKEKRKILGILEEDFFLLSVGEINANKNQKIVVEALSILKKRKGSRPIRYGIVGDGFFREKLQDFVEKKGMEKEVIFYGYCSNPWDYIGCADAVIFPSKREGLGMAGLEALAMGVPLLASDNRGTREYMEHGKNGFLFQYNDVKEVAKSIENIRNLDEKTKREMRQECVLSVKPFENVYAGAVMQRIYTEMEKRMERRNGKK